MDSPKFQPGFRLSVLDRAVILLGGITTMTAAYTIPWLGFVIGFVMLHFFLFCNVFRISRPLELAWAALFLTLAGGTLLAEFPGWQLTAAISLAASFCLVAWAMTRPSYHGLGWQWINPGLRQWWEAQRQDSEA